MTAARPALPPTAEATRRRHLRYAVLEAVALGVLANAPVVALRILGAPPWQLALALVPSSLGIFLDLYIGSRMARASKVPYVQGAIGVFACAALGMSLTDDPLVFNALHGVGNLGQIIAQMALGGVVRAAYPPAVRGAIAGRVRRFASLAYFSAAGGGALIIEAASNEGHELISARILIGLAALLAVVAAVGLRGMPIDGSDHRRPDDAPGISAALRTAQRIIGGDLRFRRYLVASLASALGGLIVAPFVTAFLVRDLGLAYLATVAIGQLLPKAGAVVTTEAWGRLADGRNPWAVWTGIRTLRGSSFMLLGLAASLVGVSPIAALCVAIAAKTLYGAVMGGSWILYWQLGVAHFAPPGADTSRYMGLITAVSGAARLAGPSLGAVLLSATGAVAPVFLIGGSFSLCSAWLCARGRRLDGEDPRFRTIAAFEASASEEES